MKMIYLWRYEWETLRLQPGSEVAMRKVGSVTLLGCPRFGLSIVFRFPSVISNSTNFG